MRKATTSRTAQAILKARRIREKMRLLESIREHETAILLNRMVDEEEAEREARARRFQAICKSRDCSML